MSDLDFAYAVARIRVLENGLLSNADIEQMIAAPDEERALAFLKERGWGDPGASEEPEELLAAESTKTRALLRELKLDPELLSIFAYQDMYHNLKAAVKTVCTGTEHPGIFTEGSGLDREEALRIVKGKAWNDLPEHMREAAQDAYETLLHTGDGQLCDVIIDRAALTAVKEAGEKAKVPLLKEYARMFVSVADIRIAVRSARTGKSREFLDRALAPCEDLDVKKLGLAAMGGEQELFEYLQEAGFADAAEAAAESPSAFERWCDNRLIETIRPQKYNPFSAGPLIAYYLAKENEIKMARIILTARANELPEETIRERVREMYV